MKKFFSSNLIKQIFLIASLTILSVNNVMAACEASEDPCAPPVKSKEQWDKSLAFGYNLTAGNSDTSLLSILGAAKRDTGTDIYEFGSQYFFGTNKVEDVEGATSSTEEVDDTVRNDLRAQGSYKHLLSDRLYVGATSNILYDEIADIDYRFGITPNIGYFLAKNPDYSFALDIGPGYIFERVGGIKNDYLAPRIGDSFEWIISCTSKVYQKADIVLDTEDSKNYILTAEAGIEAAISTDLALVLAGREIYDNVPAAGNKKSDFILTTAIKVTL
jgi:putative salt-induced outer membrane protein YdiY